MRGVEGDETFCIQRHQIRFTVLEATSVVETCVSSPISYASFATSGHLHVWTPGKQRRSYKAMLHRVFSIPRIGVDGNTTNQVTCSGVSGEAHVGTDVTDVTRPSIWLTQEYDLFS